MPGYGRKARQNCHHTRCKPCRLQRNEHAQPRQGHALNLLADDGRLEGNLYNRVGPAILTPHPAEAGRLLLSPGSRGLLAAMFLEALGVFSVLAFIPLHLHEAFGQSLTEASLVLLLYGGQATDVLRMGTALTGLVAGVLFLRDEPGTAKHDLSAHGSGFDRVSSFRTGFSKGPKSCADYRNGDPVVVELPFNNAADQAAGGDARWRNHSNPQGHELRSDRARRDAGREQRAVLRRNCRRADTSRRYAGRADHLDVLTDDREAHSR